MAPDPGSLAEHFDRDEPGGADLCASHDDRDRAVEVLRVAAGDGRITAEELDERVGAAPARAARPAAGRSLTASSAPAGRGGAGVAGTGREEVRAHWGGAHYDQGPAWVGAARCGRRA